MLTENLIRFADRLGWQKLDKENLAFGLYNGYPVTIVIDPDGEEHWRDTGITDGSRNVTETDLTSRS